MNFIYLSICLSSLLNDLRSSLILSCESSDLSSEDNPWTERGENRFATSYLKREYVNLIIESHFCSVTYVLLIRFICSIPFQMWISADILLTTRTRRNPFSVNGKTTNDIIVPTSIRWTSTCRLKNFEHSDKRKEIITARGSSRSSSSSTYTCAHLLLPIWLNKSFEENERKKDYIEYSSRLYRELFDDDDDVVEWNCFNQLTMT